MRILIADSGSTKTSWCLLDNSSDDRFYFTTEGYNPYYVGAGYIETSLSSNLPLEIPASKIEHVYFYGAGCYAEKAEVIRQGLSPVFVNAGIEVNLDILAASRALLGNSEGFVSILGTGTNTCIYDGEAITHNIDSLGFILGDEGSGAYIGKAFLSDFLRGKIPDNLERLFFLKYKTDRAGIFEKIYNQPYPNRFCAGFAQFVLENSKQHAYCDDLIENCFKDFFERLVSAYPSYTNYSFNCVGSIAWHFRPWLEDMAQRYGMKPGKIIDAPIKELVSFHQAKN